jgi:hypothetical protein
VTSWHPFPSTSQPLLPPLRTNWVLQQLGHMHVHLGRVCPDMCPPALTLFEEGGREARGCQLLVQCCGLCHAHSALDFGAQLIDMWGSVGLWCVLPWHLVPALTGAALLHPHCC